MSVETAEKEIVREYNKNIDKQKNNNKFDENKTNKKPIEFVSYLKEDFKFSKKDDAMCDPSEYEYIELISKVYYDEFDLMLEYDDPRHRITSTLYKGYFNDGVVE